MLMDAVRMRVVLPRHLVLPVELVVRKSTLKVEMRD
jgi:hypothetical protein